MVIYTPAGIWLHQQVPTISSCLQLQLKLPYKVMSDITWSHHLCLNLLMVLIIIICSVKTFFLMNKKLNPLYFKPILMAIFIQLSVMYLVMRGFQKLLSKVQLTPNYLWRLSVGSWQYSLLHYLSATIICLHQNAVNQRFNH